MSKQIQKIISFINNNKIPKKSNISKKISNNSFLNNTSNKIQAKNKLQIKHNKNITIDNIIDNNLTKEIIGNCKTEQNENIKNDDYYALPSFTDNKTCKNISAKKLCKKNDTSDEKINSKLINYMNNKTNNKKKHLNRIIKKGHSLLGVNQSIKNENDENEKTNESNYNNNEEENPVRKVKNIIINAKRNNGSINKDRNNKKEREDNYTMNCNNFEKYQKRYKFHKQNSSEINDKTYNNIHNDIFESLNEINLKKDNNTNNHDKNINYYENNSFKIRQRDRESMQILHDGMKNIKNRLIFNKLINKRIKFLIYYL